MDKSPTHSWEMVATNGKKRSIDVPHLEMMQVHLASPGAVRSHSKVIAHNIARTLREGATSVADYDMCCGWFIEQCMRFPQKSAEILFFLTTWQKIRSRLHAEKHRAELHTLLKEASTPPV